MFNAITLFNAFTYFDIIGLFNLFWRIQITLPKNISIDIYLKM